MFFNYNSFFTPEAYIDAIQSTKRGLTDKIITDKTLNKAAHDYIDAQSAFAKMLTKNATDIAKYSVDSVSKCLFPKIEEKTAATSHKTQKEAV